MKIYSTAEVAEMMNEKIANMQTYARNYGIKKVGGKSGIFLWSEEDIEKYKSYIEKRKIKRNYPETKTLPKTDNLDTLYHRLWYAKKQGNQTIIEETKRYIEEVRAEKKSKKDNVKKTM